MDCVTTQLLAEPRSTAKSSTANSTSVARGDAHELRQLQRDLLRAVADSADNESLLSAIGNAAKEAIQPLAVQYFDRKGEGPLAPAWQAFSDDVKLPPEAVLAPLLGLSNLACQNSVWQTASFESLDGVRGISVPVFMRKRPPEALAIAVAESTDAGEQTIAILQLIASHITMWNMLQDVNQEEADAQATAALLETLAKLGASGSLPQAGYQLASALQQQIPCQRVAIGLSQHRGRRCALVGLSEHPKFDRNSKFVRSLEFALEATILRGTLATWPDAGQTERQATRAEQKVCVQNNSQSVVSAPLNNEAGDCVGAWLFLGGEELGRPSRQLNVIRASAMPVGSWLQLVQRAERGSLARLTDSVMESRKSGRVKLGFAFAGLLTAVLCLPLHYKVKCDCAVQPFTHRFVAAPFDGRLEKSLVGPGDVVRAGAVLARMEGRDTRWELAGVEADHGQATKRRDAALAGHDMVASQLAKLEVERLELKTKILEDRCLHLEIKSPVDGVVISGDQERAEGAPLSMGQSLFEVAPLEKMIVEIAVPEDEITHVQPAYPVVIQLDAFPGRNWNGTIEKIHPRAEAWEESHVFIAEVHVHNEAGVLRPGMNGQAKIRADRHTLAWNLLHKPWQLLVSAVGL